MHCPRNLEKYTVNLENSALTHLSGKLAAQADAGFTLARTSFDSIPARQTTFANAVMAGDIKVEGQAGKLGELIGMLDDIPQDFPVVKPVQAKPKERRSGLPHRVSGRATRK